jgi:hypothetical protein
MSAELRRHVPAPGPQDEFVPVAPFAALVQLGHLLKVTASLSQDANQTWADIWGELRQLATGGGLVGPAAEKGFVPPCGWPELLEKFWRLKHHLDSIQRICEA